MGATLENFCTVHPLESIIHISFLKKLRTKPSYDPTIPLLGRYLEKTKTEKDTCTPVFTAALFTIARTWKQFRCPSTDEWIKKLWYINIYCGIYISYIYI